MDFKKPKLFTVKHYAGTRRARASDSQGTRERPHSSHRHSSLTPPPTSLYYPGEVVYDIFDFLEKSKDFISPDLIHALRKSSSPIIAELFPVEKSSGKTAGEARRTAVGVMAPHVNGIAYPTPHAPCYRRAASPPSV